MPDNKYINYVEFYYFFLQNFTHLVIEQMKTSVWGTVSVSVRVLVCMCSHMYLQFVSVCVCARVYACVHFPYLSLFSTLEHLVLWKALIQAELHVNALCTSQERTAPG